MLRGRHLGAQAHGALDHQPLGVEASFGTVARRMYRSPAGVSRATGRRSWLVAWAAATIGEPAGWRLTTVSSVSGTVSRLTRSRSASTSSAPAPSRQWSPVARPATALPDRHQCRTQRDGVSVSIRDNGTGIDPA